LQAASAEPFHVSVPEFLLEKTAAGERVLEVRTSGGFVTIYNACLDAGLLRLADALLERLADSVRQFRGKERSTDSQYADDADGAQVPPTGLPFRMRYAPVTLIFHIAEREGASRIDCQSE
jgi:hypothetical protein